MFSVKTVQSARRLWSSVTYFIETWSSGGKHIRSSWYCLICCYPKKVPSVSALGYSRANRASRTLGVQNEPFSTHQDSNLIGKPFPSRTVCIKTCLALEKHVSVRPWTVSMQCPCTHRTIGKKQNARLRSTAIVVSMPQVETRCRSLWRLSEQWKTGGRNRAGWRQMGQRLPANIPLSPKLYPSPVPSTTTPPLDSNPLLLTQTVVAATISQERLLLKHSSSDFWRVTWVHPIACLHTDDVHFKHTYSYTWCCRWIVLINVDIIHQ